MSLNNYEIITCLMTLVIIVIPCFKTLRPLAPTLMTSAGIVGTFLGITCGLWSFDVNDIDSSIPLLLEGLKTSFITSLVGLIGSTLFKIFQAHDSKGHSGDGDRLVTMWYELHQEQYQLQIEQNAALDKMAASVAGSGTSTLIDEIKKLSEKTNEQAEQERKQYKAIEDILTHLVNNNSGNVSDKIESLRHDMQKRHDQDVETQAAFEKCLWNELQAQTEALSKSATQDIMEALQNVIRDFNDQLTEQFGQNFKELNQAVFKLVDWQENYKQQLAEMSEQYQHGVQAIRDSEQSISLIAEHTQKIPETMALLDDSLDKNQQTIADMNEYLTAFAELKDQAVSAFPELKQQISETFAEVEAAHQEAMQSYASLMEHSKEHQVQYNELLKHLVRYTNETADSLNDNSQQLNQQLTESVSHAEAMAEEFTGTLQLVAQSNQNIQDEFKRQQDELISESKNTMLNIGQEIENAFQALQNQQTEASEQVHETVCQAIDKQLKHTLSTIEQQMQALDKNLAEELTRTIGMMGQGLTSITDRFTKDYSRLTNQMQQVVNQAKHLD